MKVTKYIEGEYQYDCECGFKTVIGTDCTCEDCLPYQDQFKEKPFMQSCPICKKKAILDPEDVYNEVSTTSTE